MNKENLKVLIVGASGRGKTFALRNLNPNTTGLINVENKPLPFKNEFKYHFRPTKFIDAYNKLVEFGQNPDINIIVIDSLSAYTDLLLGELRVKYKGFDIWSNYNLEVGKLLDMIKRVPKEVYVTAHYEILGIEGVQEKRVKVKAKEWEGQIEKEFTIVLYIDSKLKDGKPVYFLNAYQEGTSAKCPPDLLGKDLLSITNDLGLVSQKINEYYS